MAGFSISRMITELPLVYRKFFPFGSPPRTSGVPRCVLGRAAKVYSANTDTPNQFFTTNKIGKLDSRAPFLPTLEKIQSHTHCLNKTL